jgi:hypothetical protein
MQVLNISHSANFLKSLEMAAQIIHKLALVLIFTTSLNNLTAKK